MTLIGTWALRLDQAIYLGVAVSVISYLYRARMLTVHPMVFDEAGRLHELAPDDPHVAPWSCPKVRLINVEGQLFFGAASELADAIDEVLRETRVEVVILRLRRARGLDVTALSVISGAAERLAAEGRHLLLVGAGPRTTALLRRTGVAHELGADHVYPTTLGWFEATDTALHKALELVGDHGCGARCPLAVHLATDDRSSAAAAPVSLAS